MICHLKTSDRKHEVASILCILPWSLAMLCCKDNLDSSDNLILPDLRGVAIFTAGIYGTDRDAFRTSVSSYI